MVVYSFVYFADNGKFLVLTDSMAKYVVVDGRPVSAFRGDTIERLTDRIRFGSVDVSTPSRILIHVGSNDISDMLRKDKRNREGLHDILRRYRILHTMICNRNSHAQSINQSLFSQSKCTKYNETNTCER